MQIQNKGNTKMEQSNYLEQVLNRVGLIIDISKVQEYIIKSKKIQDDLGINSFIPAEIKPECLFKALTKVYEQAGKIMIQFDNLKKANEFMKEYTFYINKNFPSIKLRYNMSNQVDDDLMMFF